MVDFLKAFPFVTMEEYIWKYSLPMIKLMSIDNTRVHYLSEKQAEKKKAKKINTNNKQELNDLGIPIFGI
jgi:hypothetical protein